jgi:hypothetical protein
VSQIGKGFAARSEARCDLDEPLGLRDPQIDHDIKGCTRWRPPPGQQGTCGT